MPTVALIGPELYPIPPIRGGAAELFIDKVAGRLTDWRPVVIGVSDPELPRRETRDRVEYRRVPLKGWRRWLYRRYRHLFLFTTGRSHGSSMRSGRTWSTSTTGPCWPCLDRRLPGRIPVILHMHNLYDSLGKRERPAPGPPCRWRVSACSHFVLDRERQAPGAGGRPAPGGL